MSWSLDISAAPRDRQILLRTTNGGVYLTRWLSPTKFTPSGRFDGFPENAKTILAWCDVPKFEETALDALTRRMVVSPEVPADTFFIIDDIGSI